jgi:hypothetical protein
VAKLELAKVRQVRHFDLELFNIRSPPADVDAKEAKRWRRLYQYDIVSYFTLVKGSEGTLVKGSEGKR